MTRGRTRKNIKEDQDLSEIYTAEEIEHLVQVSEDFANELVKDHNHVLNPDVETPYRSLEDAIERLLPYHVFQYPEQVLEPPKPHEHLRTDQVLCRRLKNVIMKLRLVLDADQHVPPPAYVESLRNAVEMQKRINNALISHSHRSRRNPHHSYTRTSARNPYSGKAVNGTRRNTSSHKRQSVSPSALYRSGPFRNPSSPSANQPMSSAIASSLAASFPSYTPYSTASGMASTPYNPMLGLYNSYYRSMYNNGSVPAPTSTTSNGAPTPSTTAAGTKPTTNQSSNMPTMFPGAMGGFPLMLPGLGGPHAPAYPFVYMPNMPNGTSNATPASSTPNPPTSAPVPSNGLPMHMMMQMGMGMPMAPFPHAVGMSRMHSIPGMPVVDANTRAKPANAKNSEK